MSDYVFFTIAMQNLEHWAKSLAINWGINAELSALDGEYDLNLRGQCKNSRKYLVKVMRPGCDVSLVQMQCDALKFIGSRKSGVKIPQVIPSQSGHNFISLPDELGASRIVWVLTFIEGETYAQFSPKSKPLIAEIGASLAELHVALGDFEHVYLHRNFKWNLMQADWISDQVDVLKNKKRREWIASVIATYKSLVPELEALPFVAVHSDFNDYNLLVTASFENGASLSGILDFGDMCAAPRVCDIAIAGAYLILDHPNPEQVLCSLVAAYHSILPLTEAEIDLVYPLVLTRLAVSVVNSTIEALANPSDPYVTIS